MTEPTEPQPSELARNIARGIFVAICIFAAFAGIGTFILLQGGSYAGDQSQYLPKPTPTPIVTYAPATPVPTWPGALPT